MNRSDVDLGQIASDHDASGEVARHLASELLEHALVLARTMVGQHEGLGIGAGCDLAHAVSGRQRMLRDAAKVLVLDLRARHVAAVHQHIGIARKAIDAIAGDRVATDRDDLALRLEAVAVADPPPEEGRREPQSVAVLDDVGANLVFSNAAIVVALTRLAKAIFEGGRGARGGGWGAVI